MASELTLNANLTYRDATGAVATLEVAGLTADVATKVYAALKQTVGITAEPLLLGDVSGRGWCMVVNRDPTNAVVLVTGDGGVNFAQMNPGEFCLFRFGPNVSAPFVIANVAPCVIESLLISA